ncbi:amidohydrolase [Colletotrichum abscissum]|uniref:Amidohydrolase n=1 Tax=Colletotrichum abscissum TaxID=1671311 RepID=A0A9P9XTM6_9PEZI|nr:amidohydrolase [Colletotrichum abscissum]KAI3559626.1 amidohydrolase [Colletotrichum abscissum]KAK1486131.1 amidohydrolase [Colletotrichum abscissum]
MVTEADLKPWLRSPVRRYILTNATIVDVTDGSLRPNAAIQLKDGYIDTITDSTDSAIKIAVEQGFEVIDCSGKFICPGLIDSHVHFVAVPGFGDLSKAFGNANDVSLLRQPYVAAQMLHRGFTSVRDCGGAQQALKEAINDGVFPGPRLFIAGHALSQAGGHGDIRGIHDHSECCGGSTNGLGRLCNGVPECMTAVREEIRGGADFIKIMGSGGVSTPTDRIDHLQFTGAEIRAMVECASNAGTYVTAHAYTTKAIRYCIDNGVRGIEHGNFVDAPTAKLMAEKGVYLTPTLITYAQMASPKWKGYLPPESMSKNEEVLNAGLVALKTAYDAGVTICFGTDLLGPLGAAQSFEFSLRSRAVPSLAVLQSATLNAAKMAGREDSLGQIKEGFEADLLITDANPVENVSIFDDPEAHVFGVLKEGRIYKSRWSGLVEDATVPVRIKPAL